jgi:outer membrane protein assembly factor BamB
MKYLPLILVLLSGCDSLPDWMGSAEEPKLKGERVAVISYDINLTPDPLQAEEKVEFEAAPEINFSAPKIINAGEPTEKVFALVGTPVIEDGKIFITDGAGIIRAFDAKTLAPLWTFNPYTDDDKTLPGGGLSFAFGIVYSSTGHGDIIAVSAETGLELWRKNLGAAIRRASSINEKAVFVATADNQLYALSVVNGETLWRHSGSGEPTINYGSPTPVVKDELVVVAYSSGEVFGINTVRGSEAWVETLSTGTERRKTASNFVDVSAAPVIVDAIAYIASQNGNVVALNLNSGFRIWDLKTGAISSTPAVIGKFIFVSAEGKRLVAINRFDGSVKWVTSLPEKEDPKETITWSGPVANNGKLYLVNSKGQLLEFDANSGTVTKTITTNERIYSQPIIKDGKMYLLTSNGELVVY